MSSLFTRRRATRAGVTLAAAVTVAAGIAAPAAAAPAGSRAVPGASTPRIGQKVDLAALASGPASRSWFVRFRGEGGLAAELASGQRAGRIKGFTPAARARVQAVQRVTDAAVSAAHGADKQSFVLYRTSWTVPGVAIHADAAAIRALAARPDVVSVTPIVPKHIDRSVRSTSVTPMNAADEDVTGVNETWHATGDIGKGEIVAVIDTGLDYTHADFGGSGVPSDWYAASRNATMVAGTYDPDVVVPGHDFAGQNYDGQTDLVPVPDDNPLDGPGGGHGTHVSGTVAGRGVSADGTTFTGDYRTLTTADAEKMDVEPGVAPGAKIMPLKVFGDYGGSTDLAGAALEWVGRAVASGQRIDVVNMSLGSSYSPVDDPENDLVAALVKAGVLPVISSGNSGDVTDVAGSPGDAPAALTVAASASGFSRLDAVQVYAPSGLQDKGPFVAQYAEDQPDGTLDDTGPVTNLTDTSNLDGCQPFSAADKARVDGKIVWLEWDDAKVSVKTQCGSAVRFQNANAAGAAAVVLAGTTDSFEAGIAGDASIPGAEITKASADTLRPAMQAGTLVLRLADELKQTVNINDPALKDTLATFSSRGVHGSIDDVVKPDVSAPGVNVLSAAEGTGTGSMSMSGTSMASPHTAGIVALARAAHPTWTAQRIKALVMNTAAHEVTSASGKPYSNLMQGTGRVDAAAAVASQVTVQSMQNGPLVTASFGVVQVAKDGIVEHRTLQLTNTDTSAHTYAVGYHERVATPGVRVSVSPSSVTVPTGGTAKVTVTLSIPKRSALRRTLDPGQPTSRLTSHVPNTSGVVTFTASGSTVPPLWVAVFAAPKPVSTLKAAGTVTVARTATTAPLSLTGSYLDQGTGVNAWRSRITPLVAGPTSPRLAVPSTSTYSLTGMDVLQVGAASTAPTQANPAKGMLAVGIRTAGPIVGLGVVSFPVVYLDLNRDGIADYEIYASYNSTTNLPEAVTADIGTSSVVDVEPINGLRRGNLGQWDNDTVVLPVRLAALGYTRTTKATTLRYWVSTESQYAPFDRYGNRKSVDTTARTSFDVFRPSVWFTQRGTDAATSTAFAVRKGGAPIVVHRTASTRAAKGKLLLIAHDNATGARTSVMTWRAAAHPKAGGHRAA